VADAAQHLAHGGAGGRRIEPGGAVLMRNGGGPAGDGGGTQAGIGEGGEIAAQQAGRAGQGLTPRAAAQRQKSAQSAA